MKQNKKPIPIDKKIYKYIDNGIKNGNIWKHIKIKTCKHGQTKNKT